MADCTNIILLSLAFVVAGYVGFTLTHLWYRKETRKLIDELHADIRKNNG